MYSADLVRWLMTIAQYASPAAPVYNVGSDQGYTMIEIAEAVGAYFGVEVDSPKILHDSLDRYVPSIQKAKKELGLTVGLDLPMAIKSTVEAIRKREHLN